MTDAEYTRGRFSGKVAIVTGGASGIGQATVERFVSDGAAVAVFDINESNGKELEAKLKKAGHNVVFHKVDVSDKAQCLEAVAKVAEAHEGQIHMLVNSAVYFGSEGLDAKKEDWQKTMEVNIQGTSNMVQACHPYMKKAGPGKCSVVNISSVSAYQVQPDRWTYAASKGGIVTMTKFMALDLSADGIRVNSVRPAMTYTPQVAKTAGGDREKWEPIWGKFHLLRRLCEPFEVAAAIAFLCSRDASFITGTDLGVDGGYSAMGPEKFGEDSVFSKD